MSDTVEELKQHLAETEAQAAKFERLHADSTIRRELREAAENGGAFNADQLLPYLTPNAKLVDANGQHVVRVVTTGEDGKEVHHTPAQAVAHLKQIKDLENLFRPAPAAQPAPAAPPKIDWEHMSHEQFLEIRAKHPEWIGLVLKRR